MGGIQLDFMGHARANDYDLAYGEAVTRPTRFISAGLNGVCNTTKAGDDIQVIPVNQGYPDAICILPGPNNVINTTPGAGDTRVGMTITAGANGVCNTTAAGDDVQQILSGRGQPYSRCIAPGANSVLNTNLSSDDTYLNSTINGLTKATGTILQTAKYQQKGRVSSMVQVMPLTYYTGGKYSAWYNTWGYYPLMVRVLDENGYPKSGVAPLFTVTSGNGRFRDGRGSST
jgi:hypothetical protein